MRIEMHCDGYSLSEDVVGGESGTQDALRKLDKAKAFIDTLCPGCRAKVGQKHFPGCPIGPKEPE